jgi:acyl-CoA synthetase (NDP forming)
MIVQEVRWLPEPEAVAFLRPRGVPYPEHALSHSREEAASLADRIGYPVVLKIVSPDVLHKSEAGGVVTDVASRESARRTYDQVVESVMRRQPQARVEGVMVCRQAPPGPEFIIGGLRDRSLGPCVMVGSGGVLAEVLADVSFGVGALDRQQAEEMIREIKGYRLLLGHRGEDRCDLAALADLIVCVSRVMRELEQVEELDLNPVRVFPTGLLALDIRLQVRNHPLI